MSPLIINSLENYKAIEYQKLDPHLESRQRPKIDRNEIAKKKALTDFNLDMKDIVNHFANTYKVVLDVIPDPSSQSKPPKNPEIIKEKEKKVDDLISGFIQRKSEDRGSQKVEDERSLNQSKEKNFNQT